MRPFGNAGKPLFVIVDKIERVLRDRPIHDPNTPLGVDCAGKPWWRLFVDIQMFRINLFRR